MGNKKIDTYTLSRIINSLPKDETDSILETLEIMSDSELMKMLEISKKEAEDGKLISWEIIKKSLSE